MCIRDRIRSALPGTAFTIFALGPWPLRSQNAVRLSPDALVHGVPAVSAPLLQITTTVDGVAELPLLIPPSLAGTRFILQAAATPGGNVYALTNGLLGTIW